MSTPAQPINPISRPEAVHKLQQISSMINNSVRSIRDGNWKEGTRDAWLAYADLDAILSHLDEAAEHYPEFHVNVVEEQKEVRERIGGMGYRGSSRKSASHCTGASNHNPPPPIIVSKPIVTPPPIITPPAIEIEVEEMPTETAFSNEALEALIAERDSLAGEKNDLTERLKKAYQEFNSVRSRIEREKGELLQYAVMDRIKELLPVLDDFERAMAVETADQNYSQGVSLIYNRLTTTLQKFGVETLTTVGEQFNPNFHQALSREESDSILEVADNVVIQEYQKGYKFQDKILRPAMVRVLVSKPKDQDQEKES